MDIAVLGNGVLARGLGKAWADAGHTIRIGGRTFDHAVDAATHIGPPARAMTPAEAVNGADAALVAVPYHGLANILDLAGGPAGALEGVPLIEPTNAIDATTGESLVAGERSVAERVADLAPGALVVKAFHLQVAGQWANQVIPLAGDSDAALAVVGRLVHDVDAFPIVRGTLRMARELETVAGFVGWCMISQFNPHTAILPIPEQAFGPPATMPAVAPAV